MHGGPGHVAFCTPVIACFVAVLTKAKRATFSALPMVTRMTGRRNIHPSHPLSVTIITSRVTVATSPVSTTIIFFSNVLRPLNISCLSLLTMYVPSAFLTYVINTFITGFLNYRLGSSPICRRHLTGNLVGVGNSNGHRVLPATGASICVFYITVITIITCTAVVDNDINLVRRPAVNHGRTVVTLVLATTTTVMAFAGVSTSRVTGTTAFGSNVDTYIYILNIT